MLCDDLEGWDREDGREAQEGGDMCVCIGLIRSVVQQKLTQQYIVKQLYSNKDLLKKSLFFVHKMKVVIIDLFTS